MWMIQCVYSRGVAALEQRKTGMDVHERREVCSVCVNGIVLATGRMN
jgi:hypothetical protein